MSKIIIGFVGQAGSGKGTAANVLRLKHGAAVFAFSDILHDILNRIYLPPSRENLQALSLCLRQTFGQDALSNAMERQVDESRAELVVVDGIRRMDDIADLRKNPSFHLIAMDAKPEARFERIKNRNEKPGEAEMTWEGFLTMSQREAETMIADVAKQAERTLNNDGDVAGLEKQLEELISTLK